MCPGALILVCVAALLAGDVKRIPTDEAMRAVAYKTKPEYGPLAAQLKLSGSVEVDVTIAENGTVETVSVVSGNPVLGRLAVDSVKQWRFVPFKEDGKAIKVISQLAIKFTYVG